jgi:hypothetical protein
MSSLHLENNFVRITLEIIFSKVIKSALAELVVYIFSVNTTYNEPIPKVISTPILLLISQSKGNTNKSKFKFKASLVILVFHAGLAKSFKINLFHEK